MSVIISGSTGITLPDSGALSTSIGDAINITSGYVSGIQLGGVGSANLLDDYEEGTWTATIADATTAGNTGSTATGYYTKIGHQVTVHVVISNMDTTGMTANQPLYVTGLPFQSIASYNSYGSVKMDSIAFQGTRTYAWCQVGSLDTWANLQCGGSSTTDTNIDVGDITSGSSDIFFSVTYPTT